MGTKLILRHFLALATLLMSTYIYADNADTQQVTGNVTSQTNPSTTVGSIVFENYTDDTYANESAVSDYEIKTEDMESAKTDIKPSDEIIISSFDKLQTGHTVKENLGSEHDFTAAETKQATEKTHKMTPAVSGSTPNILVDSKTSSPLNIVETTTTSASSSTSERNVLVKNVSSVNTRYESTKPEKTYSSSFPSATALPVSHVHSSTDRTSKHVGHTVFKHHHIPFRHHLQLVPMDDEPFGAALMKDQRYIVSVLIPVGVGIVGAMVIMITVYGLRHVAKKHGREFPRVDIEAGRQNIASISSERTDKMLLLEDDEDNEF